MTTGKRFKGYQWTVLPITNEVIIRVHDPATAQDQERIQDGGNLVFRWRPDHPAMSFDHILEEEVDLINADYVPDDTTAAKEMVQENNADGAIPETSDAIVNWVPAEVDHNPITTTIEREKSVQFKERDDHVESKERES